MKPKIVCIIQARTGSTRLPDKILRDLEGKPMLLRVVDRVLESKLVDKVVVATTINSKDDRVVELVKKYHPRVSVMRGSEEDVLDRYYQAARQAGADIVVRVTSDNPLIDPDVIDKNIGELLADKSLDLVSNHIGTMTYPRGLDVESLPFSVLEKLAKTATEPIDREHVTIHIKRFPDRFKWKTTSNDADLSFHRWTVDREEDFKLVSEIYRRLYPKNLHFRMKDVLKLFEEDPELLKINAHVDQENKKY